jgi:tRNA G10  N-methylase Trm11
MLYAFILGKNKELSKEELVCYFETNNINYKVTDEGKEFLIIETDIDPEIVNNLGGTLKIGKITSLEQILKTDMKKRFGISLYGLPNSMKYKLGLKIKEKKKISFFQTRKPQLTVVEVLKKNLIGKEILVLKSKKTYYAITEAVYNPFEYKELDIGRPTQRGMLSIPIRLSKIMINLAKVKKGENLLDPFCGYGTILQAGLLQELNVYGTDKDKKCIKSSETNLEWLKEKYNLENKFLLKTIDVLDITKKFKSNKFHAIVSESYLGPMLRKSVTDERAEEIIKELTEFYEKVLEELPILLKDNKRIIIVLPVIITKTKKHKIKIKPKNIKLIKTIEDIEPKHITGREIFIFEK